MAKKEKSSNVDDFIPCDLRELTADQQVEAAETAVRRNPLNRPRFLRRILEEDVATPQAIAVLTTKYWGTSGVRLGVYFMDNPPADLRARLLEHMNAWGASANVTFLESADSRAEVRIARARGQGYWSYLGTDILLVPPSTPTMNLDGFTMSTPEAEYRRVVRHETGHTLGFPHEHLRTELVEQLDPLKTYEYFHRTYGWSAQQTRQQVLTPIPESQLTATAADETSIMCYQLPGSITKDGQPIPGGPDINAQDAAFAASIYPAAAPPVPPAEGGGRIIVEYQGRVTAITGVKLEPG